MDSRRVRFLFFLVLLVLCAQFLELYALAALGADHSPTNRHAPEPLDLATFLSAVFLLLAPTIGPLLVFAFVGLVAFRRFYWALWSLVLWALLYTAFILLGLLGEYGMARAAMAAADAGSRYMNCAGHPRLFFFLFAFPLMAGELVVSTFVFAVEALIHTILERPKRVAA